MDGAEVAELLAVLVVLGVVAPLIWMIGRLRWLSRLGGSFECGLRLQRQRLRHGVARYNGEYLEWFRSFSFSLSPQQRLRQNRWEIASTRDPDAAEGRDFVGLDSIVQLKRRNSDERLELAISPQSGVGLRSWLESAPAGRGRYGNTVH